MKLFAAMLLSIMSIGVYAQNVSPPIDYTVTQTAVGAPLPLQNINQNQGTALSLADDSTSQPISLGFDFTFYGQTFNNARISNNGLITFQNPIQGCCSGFDLSNPGNNYAIFGLQTDLLNIGTNNPWYRQQGEQDDRQFTVGWYNMPVYADSNFRSTFEITLYENTNNILINYGNINLGNRRYTAGIKGDNSEFEILYSGNNDNFLDYTSFTLSTVPQVNCLTDPGNIECTLNAYTDPETIAGNVVDDIVEDIIDEDNIENTNNDEVLVEEDEIIEENNTENLEELLSEDTAEENTEEQEENTETVNNETAVIREIANEERASTLTDNISVNVLELALSVSENASQTTTTANETTTTQTARTASNNEATETKNEESKSDTETLLSESANETANELLDAGRNLNNQSLANIQTQSEQSSVDSNNVAETVAITSSENKVIDRVQESTQMNSDTENSNNQASEIMIVNNESNEISESIVLQSIMVETASEAVAEEQKTETISVEETTTVVDVNVEATEQMFIVDQNVEQNNQSMDNSEMELELLQAIVASQSDQKKEDDNMTFNEDEKLTLQSDINLANAFNIAPNINNLEQAGIITNKVEEKSDAEKRAEQIVAANSKEQEEINNNYMDADQSGILGAMTVDTDVTSYRSAMLNDNSLWYKPEDIYKNKVYKDNVRGMYFLEKGNTDTYKKMVDEQYGEK